VPGDGDSRIDYGFSSGGREFLVEMMRLEETDAVRAATTTKSFDDGATIMASHLHSNADDARQTPEVETLMAVQRICQKLEKDSKPHKFPPPAEKTHVLLFGFRTSRTEEMSGTDCTSASAEVRCRTSPKTTFRAASSVACSMPRRR
jgi:hypothetical protein